MFLPRFVILLCLAETGKISKATSDLKILLEARLNSIEGNSEFGSAELAGVNLLANDEILQDIINDQLQTVTDEHKEHRGSSNKKLMDLRKDLDAVVETVKKHIVNVHPNLDKKIQHFVKNIGKVVDSQKSIAKTQKSMIEHYKTGVQRSGNTQKLIEKQLAKFYKNVTITSRAGLRNMSVLLGKQETRIKLVSSKFNKFKKDSFKKKTSSDESSKLWNKLAWFGAAYKRLKTKQQSITKASKQNSKQLAKLNKLVQQRGSRMKNTGGSHVVNSRKRDRENADRMRYRNENTLNNIMMGGRVSENLNFKTKVQNLYHGDDVMRDIELAKGMSDVGQTIYPESFHELRGIKDNGEGVRENSNRIHEIRESFQVMNQDIKYLQKQVKSDSSTGPNLLGNIVAPGN